MHACVFAYVELLLKHITEVTNHQVQLVEDVLPQVSRHLFALVWSGQALQDLWAENLAHFMLRAGQRL